MTADFSKKNIELEILLPEGSKISVRTGDKLGKGGEVASSKPQVEEIDLAKALGIASKKVGKCLLVSLGSTLSSGQTIAEKKGLFKKRTFQSPFDGILESLSENGVIKIRKKQKEEKVQTPVEGVVKKIEEGRVLISVPVLTCLGNFATGSGGWGILKIASAKPVSDLDDLGEETEGKVLAYKGKVTSALVYKAEALGVAGLVVGSVDENIKCEEVGIFSFGSQKSEIADNLWEAMVKLEGQPARILPEKKTLIIGLLK